MASVTVQEYAHAHVVWQAHWNTWMMCEARSRQFEVWQEKTKVSRKREGPPELEEFDVLASVMRASPNAKVQSVITKLSEMILGTFVFQFHGLRGLSHVAVVWQVTTWHHLLWLSLWFLHLNSASAFFSGLVCFTLIPSTTIHLWNQPCCARRCLRQYTDAELTLLCSLIKRDWSKCAHVHTNTSSESNFCHQD